jgi:hypothetical protein
MIESALAVSFFVSFVFFVVNLPDPHGQARVISL